MYRQVVKPTNFFVLFSVKGVNFYGPKSEFVVSGSDCGNVYLWDVESEQVVNYFHADENGVVSVQFQFL